jgi:ribose transport system substrate-binding protein
MKIAASRLRRLRGTSVGVAALAVAALGLAACSSSSTTEASSSSSSSSDSGVTYAEAQIAKYTGSATVPSISTVSKAASLKGKTVWYVPLTDSLASFQEIGVTMTTALAKLGATVHTCSGNAEPSTISQCLNSAASSGAAAVVTNFVSYSEVPTAFSALVKDKIPVVIGGESPSSGATNSRYLHFLSFDAQDFKASDLQSDEVIADSNGQADVLAIRITDSPATEAGANAGVAEFRAHCPGCKVTVLDTSQAESSKLPSSIAAELVKDPDIDYVIGVDNDLSDITSGISSAGKAHSVKVVTWLGNLSGLQELSANSSTSSGLIADVGITDAFQGLESADAVVRMLSGDSVPAASEGLLRVFTHSNVSDLTLTNAASATTQWFGVSMSSFADAYYEAWGVS